LEFSPTATILPLHSVSVIEHHETIIDQNTLADIYPLSALWSTGMGGPVAQIAMIRRELVDEEQLGSNAHFNWALSVYQILPGPEAHELCVYFGMLAGEDGRVPAALDLCCRDLYYAVTHLGVCAV
jgi:hypothetical protein